MGEALQNHGPEISYFTNSHDKNRKGSHETKIISLLLLIRFVVLHLYKIYIHCYMRAGELGAPAAFYAQAVRCAVKQALVDFATDNAHTTLRINFILTGSTFHLCMRKVCVILFARRSITECNVTSVFELLFLLKCRLWDVMRLIFGVNNGRSYAVFVYVHCSFRYNLIVHMLLQWIPKKSSTLTKYDIISCYVLIFS